MACNIDDPDLSLADLFRSWPAAARPFLRRRTACVGCLMARFHTVLDTCSEYGLDEAAFRAELRAATSPPRRSTPRGGADR